MSLCPDAHEQKVIHFSLRVPDYWREEGRKFNVGVCSAIEVSGDKYSADLSQGRQRATRASVPLNVLENSLTLWSVALHLPIVASRARPRTETPLRGEFGKSGFNHPRKMQ